MLRPLRVMSLIRGVLLLLAFATLATTAHAQQAVFRSVMPDGRIVFGSKPEPGAKESKQVNLAPLNIAKPVQAPPPAQSKAPTGNAEAPAPAKDGGPPDVTAARQKLEVAQKALEDGREPREGERTGTARPGMSRLNDDYYKRVKVLEDAVATAQAEYDAAQRAAR